jgi:hypothetical protein
LTPFSSGHRLRVNRLVESLFRGGESLECSMLHKMSSNFSKGNLSEIEFEKLLRRAEETYKGARPTLLKRNPVLKRLANS